MEGEPYLWCMPKDKALHSRAYMVPLSVESISKVNSFVWLLVGNGEMDPYSSPYIIPHNSPHHPFLHSLLSTRES